jgi:hypothetical protein
VAGTGPITGVHLSLIVVRGSNYKVIRACFAAVPKYFLKVSQLSRDWYAAKISYKLVTPTVNIMVSFITQNQDGRQLY